MIHTVMGDVQSTHFGNVLMHEHISCASNDFIHAFGNRWLDREELADYASEILLLLKQVYDVNLFIDGTPIDLGRDINLLRKVSEKSGVNIVASSGLYWYPSCVTEYKNEKEIASWFISECENGIENTDIKPGILKCATGELGISKDNKKRLTALAITSKETGLPIYVHCTHHENVVYEQLKLFIECGVDMSKIIIGHGAIRMNVDYFESILNYGCYIAIDQCHCFPSQTKVTGNVIATLCKKGYTDKVLLSNDICIHSDFDPSKRKSTDLSIEQQTKRFGYLFEQIYNSFIDEGGHQVDWKQMMCKNSIKILDV